jgi:hypothetical protein
VINIRRGEGKTAKGVLEVWAPQYRAIDVEDILSISRRKPAANILA